MADANQFTLPIDFDLEGCPKQTFYSAEQVLEFGQKEFEAWRNFRETVTASIIFSKKNPVDPSIDLASAIQSHAQLYIDNSPDPNHRKVVYESIKNCLNEYHNHPNYIVSRSLKAKIAFKLAKERPAAAGVLMSIITSQTIPSSNVGDILSFSEAVYHAKQALEKPKKYSTAYKSLITDIKSEWERLEAFARGDLKDKVDEANELIALIDRKTETYERHHKRRASFFRQQYVTAKESLNTLEKTYHKKLQLEAPATYWGKRKRWHLVTTVIAAILFLAGIVAVFFCAITYAPELLKLLPKGEDGSIGFGSIVMVTIPAAAIAWALRIFTRLFGHNLNMASDAAQRETMVKTYLALVNDPKSNLGADERILILNALFRPSELQGSHDAPPPHLLELARSTVAKEER